MKAFRIADRRHPLFDGTGAFLNAGRWNSRGKRVIYAAATYAGALLEQLAHANTGKLPKTQAFIEIDIPDSVAIERIEAADIVGWDSADLTPTRERGDQWHREKKTAILLVPSAVTGGMEANVLINPDHPDFRLLTASEPKDVQWDPRLIRR